MKLNYLLGLALALPLSASALDVTWSGFGTLGAVGSDQPYQYQRFIDNQGTFKRDSILGAQLDIKINSQWGATLQAKLAPASNNDRQWDPTLTWAFVSWRPLDDWLIRVGKLRLPLMLNTENTDVGATFDLARLPVEVYSIAPTTDVVGVSISKTWLAEHYDWTLEAYSGKTRTHSRYYCRAICDQGTPSGTFFPAVTMESRGLVLTVRDINNIFRIGVHEAEASRPGEGTPAEIRFTEITPSIGFYNFNSSRMVDKVRIPVQTLGASVLLPAEVRLTAEYARIIVDSSSEGFTRWGAYLAASRRFGDWTPYGYYARMKSPEHVLERYKAINGNSVPGFIPNADLINQSQKFAADMLSPYDQWTAALGTSYRLNANGLIKAEWSHTRSGVVSSFIDAPSGSDSANRQINVFSLSYNFTF